MAVIVLAKVPRPGRVKTRLQPAFTPDEAADLAGCALRDTLAAVAAARTDRRVLALDRLSADLARRSASVGFRVIQQRPGGLGDRLAGAFADVGAPALLIGMDTPQVTPGLLDVDFGDTDALLGLADDGGFWAIGLRGADPYAVFAGVPMSTPRTGAAQLARLVGLGLSVRLLPPLRDVDEPADAEHVAAAYPWLEFSRRHRQLLAARPEQTADRLFDVAYSGGPVRVRGSASGLALDIDRWSAPADAADRMVVARCEPPVLDVGCGPGRMVQALAESGQSALGIDISATAVQASRRRGGMALRTGVEDPLPAEGRWGTVLLLDGNVGIGGDVPALLRRCRELVTPGGLVICEADPRSDRHDHGRLRLCTPTGSAALAWSRIGSDALRVLAARLDLMVAEEWTVGGRVFVALRRAL